MSIASVALVAAVVPVVACGRLAETETAPTTSSELDAGGARDGDDGDGASAVIAPADASTTQVAAQRALDLRVGCTSLPHAHPGSVDGGASSATSLELHGDGLHTLHNPYDTGSFRDGLPGRNAAAACGVRGVYFGDEGCGQVSLAACADGRNGGARPCIYIETQLHLGPEERKTAPAGHYVDHTGRCWSLVDASLTRDPSDPPHGVGGSETGRFDVTAVSGGEQKRLSGFFVACLAVAYDGTCR